MTVTATECTIAAEHQLEAFTHLGGIQHFIQLSFQFLLYQKVFFDPTNPLEQPEYIALCSHSWVWTPNFIPSVHFVLIHLLSPSLCEEMCSQIKHPVVPLSLTSLAFLGLPSSSNLCLPLAHHSAHSCSSWRLGLALPLAHCLALTNE